MRWLGRAAVTETRVGKQAFRSKDSQDVGLRAICHKALDYSIAAPENLAHIQAVELGHDPTRFGELLKPPY